MPVYEYLCEEHGAFEAIRAMADHAAPCDCPICGAAAPRVMLTSPRLALMDAGMRKGTAVNEASADSPKKLSSHGPGCSCCSGGAKKGRKTLTRPDGSKSFPSARPWMLSH